MAAVQSIIGQHGPQLPDAVPEFGKHRDILHDISYPERPEKRLDHHKEIADHIGYSHQQGGKGGIQCPQEIIFILFFAVCAKGKLFHCFFRNPALVIDSDILRFFKGFWKPDCKKGKHPIGIGCIPAGLFKKQVTFIDCLIIAIPAQNNEKQQYGNPDRMIHQSITGFRCEQGNGHRNRSYYIYKNADQKGRTENKLGQTIAKHKKVFVQLFMLMLYLCAFYIREVHRHLFVGKHFSEPCPHFIFLFSAYFFHGGFQNIAEKIKQDDTGHK